MWTLERNLSTTVTSFERKRSTAASDERKHVQIRFPLHENVQLLVDVNEKTRLFRLLWTIWFKKLKCKNKHKQPGENLNDIVAQLLLRLNEKILHIV